MTHILVTRPLEASQQLAAELDVLGLISIVMPLYTFAARPASSEVQAALFSPAARKLAVFTSPRAVQFGLPLIPPDKIKNLQFAVVGSATGAKLESNGCPVHVQSQNGFTSEDLLQVPELLSAPGEAIIFCAPGGRTTLARGLGDLGWKVTRAMVYERIPLQPRPENIAALSNAENLLSIWTSISALKLAEQYLPANAWGKILASPVLVISVRIQHHLQQLGASHVELADGPGNPALLESILRMTGKKKHD
jgi:uroporphyrinogen-III synthase